MIGVWVPRFACPDCHAAAAADGAGGASCRACGQHFDWRGGVYRFLTPARSAAAVPFLRQYRLVRERDGHRMTAPEYYRMLPCVAPDDPHAAEWCLRRESYAHLQRRALPAAGMGGVRVLDLGAGCGWLSHRLSLLGHRVVAVDRLDDAVDGLGVCQHYPLPFAAVQADFDALPFEPQQFDLAVFTGSLHYSPDPAATLAEAMRMLAAGGAIAVMDSPMFAREADGRAMVADEDRRMQSEHGLTDVVRPGIGFLTFAAIQRAFRSLGLTGQFFRSRGPMAWRARRQLAWLRLGRAPAAFGVWVAQ